MNLPREVRIIDLWNQGFTIAQIAVDLAIPANTAASLILRARRRYGIAVVPNRPKRGPAVGNWQWSELDTLKRPGDTVEMLKIAAGSRPNVHQNAETRGWRVSVSDKGDRWQVTARERIGRSMTLEVSS